MRIAPTLTALILVGAIAIPACSPRVATDAQQRAENLNDRKSQAVELLAAQRYQAALDVLGPLAADASADPQVFVMMGDAHAGLDHYDDAVAAYESAIRLSYYSHEAHLKLATLLMRHERVGRALTEFELAIEYGDSHPLTHYNYGLALREMGRDDEALAQWRLAREMDPQDSRYAEAVGIGLAGTDDAAAVAHFEEAARLGADSPSFHNNYALALERLGRFDRASAEFDRAVAAAPGEEVYRFNRAALSMRAGWFERAAGEWRELIARDGRQWRYGVYLARALLSLERYRDAIAALDGLEPGAGDSAPPRHEALEILSLAHRGAGDGRAALDLIAQAVALAPDNPGYRNTYGVILAENGMLTEAKSQWRKVLEIDGENAVARENLSRFGP
jgi:Flp pilus assembly protein TadD